jgi:hypothetical protein
MTETTPRLALPLLSAGQAQKEVTHNEALLLADMAMQPVIQSAALAAPPTSPALGQCWIIAASPTGDWSGRAGQIAGWTPGGWRFLSPFAGLEVWSLASNRPLRYDGSGWIDGRIDCMSVFSNGQQVLTTRQAAIAAPSGGSVIDSEARVVLSQLLVMLRAHGLIAS